MFARNPPNQPETNLFAFRFIQKVFAVLIVALVISIIVTRFTESHRSQGELLQVSINANGDYELTITLRESMVYIDEYGQWLNGVSTRRDLQIRRALLAQRLVVKDRFGVPSGARVSREYLTALSELDHIVVMTQPGYLSEEYRAVTQEKSKASLKDFTTEARALELQVVLAKNRYERTAVAAEAKRQKNVLNLILTATLLVLSLALLLAISRSRDYRKARSVVLKEHKLLAVTQTELNQSRQEVHEAQERNDLEEIKRREVFRLDSLSMPILSKIRGSVGKQQIVDEFIAGVGASLSVDWVTFWEFATQGEQGMLADWRISGEAYDKTVFLQNEQKILVATGRLWSGFGFVKVNDVELLDTTKRPFSDLIASIKLVARSWIIIPLGEGSKVFGFISALMYNEPREWSSHEISFVQTLAANATHSMIHLRHLEQVELIAEHDSVVNRLLEIDRTRNNFIANVNHELRTPLTSIIGFLEIIQESADTDFDPDITHSFNIVMRNARRLKTLVENTLLISSLESRQAEIDIAPLDIGKLLSEIVDSLVPVALDGEVAVNLVVNDKDATLCIEGISNQIEQLFTNLISNAIKFTLKGGTVSVTARQVDAENGAVAEVTISDTGIGILAKDIDRLFDRFVRGSNAMEAMIPGSGLGLTIVKEVVNIHGGSITITSKIDEGTNFTVQLPVVRVAEFNATARDF